MLVYKILTVVAVWLIVGLGIGVAFGKVVKDANE